MKRFGLFLPLVLTLSGCAQLFDSNLYLVVDTPPKLNAGDLAKLSTTDIKKLSTDSSFYAQLKADSAALTAVQDNLNATLSGSGTTQDKMDAAATLITVTAKSTTVADVTTNAVNNIGTIKDDLSSNNFTAAFKAFLGNQTEAQTVTTLTTLIALSGTLATMQTLATDGSDYVDTTTFFLGVATADATSFAQTGLMAAIAKAMVSDNTSIAVTANLLATGGSITSAAAMTKFNTAYGAKTTVTAATNAGYSYAYLSALKSKFSF